MLGEGPVWRPERETLQWVDILLGVVHEWRPSTGQRWRRAVGSPLSFAIPRERGGLVCGLGREVVLLADDEETPVQVLAAVEPEASEHRFNDAKCDARGRLWAGTMSTVGERGGAALHRVEPDGVTQAVVTGMSISNGLGWNAESTLMYLVDTPTGRIDVFDFDAEAGHMTQRRPFARIPPDQGLPDGLAVDEDGGLWVALFGGGAVHHYSADGVLDSVRRLPASNPTCPVFGGAALDVLYMTSARHGLSVDQLAGQPSAGAVFAMPVETRGVPAWCFAG